MVHNNPGEPPFQSQFNDPSFLKSWGYTGQAPRTFFQAAITYDHFDRSVLPAGSTERGWSEKLGTRLDALLNAAAAAEIPVYPFTDVLVVPRSLMEKYGSEMRDGRNLSILKPRTEEVFRAQIAGIFERFPSLGGLTVRFGETYLQDTPYHVGGSPAASIEEHQAMVRVLREEVCVKRNKVVIYRTWEPTWGYDGVSLHTNEVAYLELTDPIEPHPNLLFGIKHAGDDFLRKVPFNATLGVGRHRQIVEISCSQAGCYGKNAHPYYLGEGVINGWEEMHPKKGVRDLVGSPLLGGVWTWSRGDGWAGPYTPNEFWVKLNAWVICQFGQQPNRAESEIFTDYTRNVLKLPPEEALRFRELCLLATSATFHAQQSALFDVSPFWCRDEYLTALDVFPVVNRSYAAVGGIPALLAEKARAVADWKRVEQLSREIHLADPQDQEFLHVSSTYGRIKIAVIQQIWIIQILAQSPRLDKEAMRGALAAYDALRAEWQDLKNRYACCPTLYVDDQAVHCGPPLRPLLEHYRRQAAS